MVATGNIEVTTANRCIIARSVVIPSTKYDGLLA